MAGHRPAVTDPVASFDAVHAAFEDAASARGPVERHFGLGGRTVRVRFAGQALVPYVDTVFAHRAVPPGPADLTVCLWDTTSTGVSMPFRPWVDDPTCVLGEVRGYHGERIAAVYESAVAFLHLVDCERNVAVSWINDARGLPSWWVSSSPLRLTLHCWLRRQPYQLVHAAAVGVPSGAVLLAGKSGSGKSTTALACLSSSLVLAGDDFVLVELGDVPVVHNLYGVAKLEEDMLPRFERLQPLANGGGPQDEKPVIPVSRHLPAKIGTALPLRAIVLPRVTGLRETAVRPATKIDALTALAPSTTIDLRVDREEAFAKTSGLVKSLPSYWLDVGTELEQIPQAILELLA